LDFATNDLWEADNDLDEDRDSLPGQFDGFYPGVPSQKATRPRRAKATNPADTHTGHTRDGKRNVQKTITSYRAFYTSKTRTDPAPGEDARPIPYAEVAKLFQRVEIWTRQTHVLNACERVEKVAKTIEEAVNKLQDRPVSYA